MTPAFSLRNVVIALAIFALNALLNIPLFRFGAMPFRDSIELGYAAMDRFFSLHQSVGLERYAWQGRELRISEGIEPHGLASANNVRRSWAAGQAGR